MVTPLTGVVRVLVGPDVSMVVDVVLRDERVVDVLVDSEVPSVLFCGNVPEVGSCTCSDEDVLKTSVLCCRVVLIGEVEVDEVKSDAEIGGRKLVHSVKGES